MPRCDAALTAAFEVGQKLTLDNLTHHPAAYEASAAAPGTFDGTRFNGASLSRAVDIFETSLTNQAHFG